MPNYPIHTIASAPEKSKSALEQLQKAFGVLPNHRRSHRKFTETHQLPRWPVWAGA